MIVLSLTLDLLSGTHCHLHIRNTTTVDIFKSALKKTISLTSKNLIRSYLPDLLCVSVCVVCGVWCVRIEEERERESVGSGRDCALMY